MSGIFGTSSATPAATATMGDLKLDVALNSPPEDTISDLAFSSAPQSNILAVASWDKKVRIYEISASGQSEGKHLYEHDGPVLSCDFSKVCRQNLPAGKGIYSPSPRIPHAPSPVSLQLTA